VRPEGRTEPAWSVIRTDRPTSAQTSMPTFGDDHHLVVPDHCSDPVPHLADPGSGEDRIDGTLA
jgi:hypothetical protein